MKDVLSQISGALFLIGFVPYIKAIVKGFAKPAKATWIIWAILNLNVLIGMVLMGTTNYQIIFIVVGTFVIAALAFRHGKSGWTTLDKYCGIGAVIGVLAVWCLDSAEAGVVISLGAGFAASCPVSSLSPPFPSGTSSIPRNPSSRPRSRSLWCSWCGCVLGFFHAR